MNETPDAASLFAPIWRRKWLILAVAVLVAAASYAYYKHKPNVFSASTEIYLGSAPEEQAVSEKGGKTKGSGELNNQLVILKSNLVAGAVTRSLHKEHDRTAKVASKGKFSAKPQEKGDLITVTTEAHSPRAAARLANAIAQAYIKRRIANHQHSVRTAIAIALRQLRRIEADTAAPPSRGKGSAATNGSSSKKAAAAAGQPTTTVTLQTANLNSKINQLESQLGVLGVEQLEPAKARKARLVSPMPKKNALFGFALALVLASIAAYALSRFDRRLQSVADIEGAFRLPILAALPRVGRPVIRRSGQPRASAALVEPLRRLHTSLALANLNGRAPGTRARTVLFVSADPGEGKSTAVATLALVQREAGERVAVVDANLRRPAQAALLGVDGTRGLSDVLTGTLPVEAATQVVASPSERLAVAADAPAADVATVVQSSGVGRLSVLASGAPAPNPPALLGSQAVSDVLRALMHDFGTVIVDAPAVLEFSDALPLLQAVEAVVIVARIGRLRDTSAQRLLQLVTQPGMAPVLGVLANGASRREINEYGFSTGRRERLRRLNPIAR